MYSKLVKFRPRFSVLRLIPIYSKLELSLSSKVLFELSTWFFPLSENVLIYLFLAENPFNFSANISYFRQT